MSRTEHGTNKIPSLSVGALSETGQREENQDNMTGFACPLGTVYLIADGMGGHKGGAEAARIVTETFRTELLSSGDGESHWDALARAAREANQAVIAKGSSGDPQFAALGSTVVIALIRETAEGLELITANVGDSRAYLTRGAKLSLITKDHTRVQWLIDAHALDESAARSHPEASVLTRAFGHTVDLAMDISDPIPLRDGDGILLCSDGLSGFARDEQINDVVRECPDPTECTERLVQLALVRGSNDNVTVQFIRIGQSPAALRPHRSRRRKTLPEGLAVSPMETPGSRTPKLALARYALAGALLGSVVAGGGVVLYRKEVARSHSAAPAAASKPKAVDGRMEELKHDADRAVQSAVEVETALEETKRHAHGKPAKRIEEHLNTLRAQREAVSRDIANLSRAEDGAQIQASAKKVNAGTAHLIAMTEQIRRSELSAATPAVSKEIKK